MTKRKQLLILCLLVMAMILSLVGCSSTGTGRISSDENQVAAMQQLEALKGSYQQLFQGATFEAKCNTYWYEAAAAVVGESMAEQVVEFMKFSIGSDFYGDNKVEGSFCCNFIGIDRITFDGNKISGTLNGKEIFSHTYEYIGEYYIGEEIGREGFGGHTFQSLDGNEDEFKYFLLLPDTMATTYHIEFRYGSNLADLQKFGEGQYANWLAAGISVEAMNEENSDDIGKNDYTLRQVIGLFCVENLSQMLSDETETQRAELVGTWDADEENLAVWRTYNKMPELNMYICFKADGTAATYSNTGSNGEYIPVVSYNYYVYDSNKAGMSGVYLSETEEGVTSTPFVIEESGNTLKLSLFAPDGTASYNKR